MSRRSTRTVVGCWLVSLMKMDPPPQRGGYIQHISQTRNIHLIARYQVSDLREPLWTRYLNGTISVNILLSFIFGVIFISVMLGFASFFPNPTDFQAKVFITTLSLAAAGVGAMLPGDLNIEYKGIARAGGALALFALVFTQQPALTRLTASLVDPAVAAEPIALGFLDDIDNDRIGDALLKYHPDAVGTSPDVLENFQKIQENFRMPLGSVVSRKLVSANRMESPPNFPVGLYRFYMYLTKFANGDQCRTESVILRATQDENWRVFGYNISPNELPC